MISFNPTQLEAWTGGRWTTSPVASLTGFTIDTRQLRAGQVFVALKTAQRDGHDFLEVAREAGASAAIAGAVSFERVSSDCSPASPELYWSSDRYLGKCR